MKKNNLLKKFIGAFFQKIFLIIFIKNVSCLFLIIIKKYNEL